MPNSLLPLPRLAGVFAALVLGAVMLAVPSATSAAQSPPLFSAHTVQAESIQKAEYYRHNRYWHHHRYSHYRSSGWYYG
jgi:hypothetical protein